jgi:hypothetical protein
MEENSWSDGLLDFGDAGVLDYWSFGFLIAPTPVIPQTMPVEIFFLLHVNWSR